MIAPTMTPKYKQTTDGRPYDVSLEFCFPKFQATVGATIGRPPGGNYHTIA